MNCKKININSPVLNKMIGQVDAMSKEEVDSIILL